MVTCDSTDCSRAAVGKMDPYNGQISLPRDTPTLEEQCHDVTLGSMLAKMFSLDLSKLSAERQIRVSWSIKLIQCWESLFKKKKQTIRKSKCVV